MSHDMCVMQWLTAKIGKKKTLMLKAEIALRAIRWVIKYNLMLKTYLQM